MADPATSTPSGKKPRFKWDPAHVKELETIFTTNQHPPQHELESLATKFSADITNVKSWFANRRTKEKRNSITSDSDYTPTTTTTTTTPITTTATIPITHISNNNNNNKDDLSDLPSVLPSAGVPKSHLPIQETNVAILHARIKELEAENYHLKQQLAKRQRDADAPAEPTAKKVKKGGKSESERLFHAWGKRLSTLAKTVKFSGSSYESTEVVVEESLTKELFSQCFVGKGVTVQPTKDNKPKSKVWIIRFATWETIEQLFGAGNIKRDGHIAWIWSRGGMPQRGFGFFGGGGGFSKSEKIRKTTARVNSLEVHYNETHSKLQLKFSCSTEGSGGGGMFGFGDYDSDE